MRMYKPTIKTVFFGALMSLICSSIFANTNISNELPVKFLRFYADQFGDEVRIRWKTESEFNNDYFTVERSKDLQLWETLEIVPGSGLTPGEGVYEYFDTEPKSGLTYYRIKQTDTDGAFDYSHVEKVDYEELISESSDVAVAPNPLPGSSMSINVNSEFSFEGATVKLLDITGKEIRSNVEINDTEMTVTPFNKTPGLYFLTIQKRNRSIVKKIKFE